MKAVLKFVQTYPAYLTSVATSGFALAALLWPGLVSPEQFKAIEGFALLVLFGWVHQSVTPNVKVKEVKG